MVLPRLPNCHSAPTERLQNGGQGPERTGGSEERVGRGDGELRGSQSRRGAASGGGRPQDNEAVFRKAVPARWPPPEDRHEGRRHPGSEARRTPQARRRDATNSTRGVHAPPRRRPSAERPRPGGPQDAGRAPDGVPVYVKRGGGRVLRPAPARVSTVAGGVGAPRQGYKPPARDRRAREETRPTTGRDAADGLAALAPSRLLRGIPFSAPMQSSSPFCRGCAWQAHPPERS